MTVLEGEEGHLDHQYYADDERKIWVIRVPENSRVQLNFSSFSLETDYDFLWLYDGGNVYAPKIGRWNTQNPGTVLSTGNEMCVEFRSDCSENDAGWEATWEAVMSTVLETESMMETGVFPNPTEGWFTVKSDKEGFTDVVVYDVFGIPMLPPTRFRESVEIDASAWPSGVYIVNYGAPSTKGKVAKLVKW